MAKLCLISLSLCFIVLFHGSRLTQAYTRQEHQQQQQQSQCQLQRLNAAQPNKRIESEGGVTEYWDENDEQFECAGVAATRHTIQPRGLLLPHFSNSPKLTYIVQGRGIQGAVIPGCPETYELPQQSQQYQQGGQSQQEKQQQQQEQKQEREQEQEEEQHQQQQQQEQKQEREQEREQEQEEEEEQQQQHQQQQQQEQKQHQQQQQEGQQQDRHQKIKDLRQGDIVAIPSGVVNWFYNDGNRPLVLVTIHHTQNSENQLDQTRREFYFAGNPQQQQQQQEGKQGKGSQQEEQDGQQSENNSNNIFQAFDDQILAVAFGVRRETVRKLKSQNDRRGNIIRVENGLQFVRPPRTEQEEDRQQGQEQQQESMTGNGIEETFCTIRYRENIGEPIRADIFNPQGGRLRSINSGTLPILENLQLSAERGVLYKNALMAPHWNMNANSVIYVTEGSARIQVVGNYQKPVFDGQLRKGQLLVVPQNFVVVKQAGNNGFEWVAFKTNDNAMTSPVAGKTSALSAMPVDVLVNAYQGLSRQEAMNLKNNRRSETLILSPRSSSQGGRDYA